MRMRFPLGSTAVDAYHVWKLVPASCVQLPFVALNPVTAVMPGPNTAPPPMVTRRPSGSAFWPPHTGLANAFGTLVKVFVAGSHMVGVLLPSPHVNSLPLGSTAPCTATMGQLIRLPH